MLVGVLALKLLAHRVAELHVRRWVVGRSQLGVRLSRSELQVGGGASPSVLEGALGLPIEVIVA